MTAPIRPSAAAATIGVVVLVVGTTYAIAAVLVWALPLPWDPGLPVAVRLLGAPLLVAGLAMLAWFFRHRRFTDVLVSTHATFVKMLRRSPLEERVHRTEPLVVVGPYRLVRHPMYTGLGLLVFGIGILRGDTWSILGALLLCLWFYLVVAPFEERELRALFGPAYDDYRRVTPRMVPLPRRRR